MSRTPGEEKRLRLFRAGNVLCPICLEAEFTEEEARRGQTVTLEDVPPKSFSAGGFQMCLTCRPCNNEASKAEQVTVDHMRRETKMAITTPALLGEDEKPLVHTGYAEVAGAGMVLRMSHLRKGISERDFANAIKATGNLGFSFTVPTAHRAGVPWLKAAYLTVFSLLGPVCGYRYAKSEALEGVRQQIRSPGEKIIDGFALRLDESGASQPQFVVAVCSDPPCWVVLMGDCIVRLPTIWDRSFYDRLGGSMKCDFKGVQHRPVKFGDVRLGLMPLPDGVEMGEDVFGAKGMLSSDTSEVPCTLVDYEERTAALLVDQGALELVPGFVRGDDGEAAPPRSP